MAEGINNLATSCELPLGSHGTEAANYLFDQLATTKKWICSGAAKTLASDFLKFISKKGAKNEFASLTENADLTPIDRFLAVSYTHLTLPTIYSV